MLSHSSHAFVLKGFIYRDIHKNKEGVLAIRAIEYKTYVNIAGNYLCMHTFGGEVHKSNTGVKRWHNKYETINLH